MKHELHGRHRGALDLHGTQVRAGDLRKGCVRIPDFPIAFEDLLLEMLALALVKVHDLVGKLRDGCFQLLGAFAVGPSRGDHETPRALGELLADDGNRLGGSRRHQHAPATGHAVADEVSDRVALAGPRRSRDAHHRRGSLSLPPFDEVDNFRLLLVVRKREEVD